MALTWRRTRAAGTPIITGGTQGSASSGVVISTEIRQTPSTVQLFGNNSKLIFMTRTHHGHNACDAEKRAFSKGDDEAPNYKNTRIPAE